MNESDLENSFRALCPAAPSPGLEDRIAAGLVASRIEETVIVRPAPEEASFIARVLQPFCWASAGAAAAVAVMLAWPAAQKPKAASPALTAAASAPEFTTAETTRELLGTQQGEVRFEKDRGLVREMRANYLEHVAWTDPYPCNEPHPL
jgi:hypothetical protein